MAVACPLRLADAEEVLRHEVVPTLQSLLIEQNRFDKEHENASAGIKFKDVQDVPIILGPDFVSRKQRHSTKHQYQSKGKLFRILTVSPFHTPPANAIVADIREALQNANNAIVAVDLPSAAWNAITANQAWVTNDAAWKALLDETPQLPKEVGTQLRDHINSKRNAGHDLIFVFSLRDERLFLYHFQ